jgi:hypothetical protein
MHDLGISHNKPYRKCARIVGEVGMDEAEDKKSSERSGLLWANMPNRGVC